MKGFACVVALAVLVVASVGAYGQQWRLTSQYTTSDCAGPVFKTTAVPVTSSCSSVSCISYNGSSVAVTCSDSQPSAPAGYAEQDQFTTSTCSGSPTTVNIVAVDQCSTNQIISCNTDGTTTLTSYDTTDTTCSGTGNSNGATEVDTCLPTITGGKFVINKCVGFVGGKLVAIQTTTGGMVLAILVVTALTLAYIGVRHGFGGFGAALPSGFAIGLISVRALVIIFAAVAGVLAASKPTFGYTQYSLTAFISLANFIVAVYSFLMILLFAFPKSFPFIKESLFAYRGFLVVEAAFLLLELISGAVIITAIDGNVLNYNAACVLTFMAAAFMVTPLVLMIIANRKQGILSAGGLSQGVGTAATEKIDTKKNNSPFY